jgi:ribosomal protein L11 methyltransferase
VIATDNDRSALPIAQANARRNKVGDDISFTETDLLDGVAGPFDVIVCNIVAEEVTRLAEGFPRLLAKNGRCIASGFVPASIPRVEDSLVRGGLQILETPSEEGWAACVAVRPERAR